MNDLTLRNANGETVTMTSYAATEAKNNFGKLMQQAARKGAIAITRHNAAEAVLMSVEQYQALIQASQNQLNDLSDEFDALLTSMQASTATRGARTAFNASPSALGKAAVKSATLGKTVASKTARGNVIADKPAQSKATRAHHGKRR